VEVEVSRVRVKGRRVYVEGGIGEMMLNYVLKRRTGNQHIKLLEIM